MGYRGARALPCGPRGGGEAGLALPGYLSERVFAGASVSTLEPTAEGVAGYERSTPTARPCPAGRRPGPTRRPRAPRAVQTLPHNMFTQKCRT